jgi:two-component system, chemotaxis family, CheB/CheR fusion protein
VARHTQSTAVSRAWGERCQERTESVRKDRTTPKSAKPVEPTSEKKDLPALDTKVPLPIIGIGASAGGLEAFEQFFTHTPPDTGMAFVLIQQLDPKHKSILSELLRRYTRMAVHEGEDCVVVEPDTIYVFPWRTGEAFEHGASFAMRGRR